MSPMLMETGGITSVAAKKATRTPKAIINEKFGTDASYKVEEVRGSTENDCPGLAISHKDPPLFRCCLQLPDFSVMSETFKRKKDAEQSAAEKALERLGIQPREDNPSTIEEAWNHLVSRLSNFFSDEFLSSTHPLSGHFKAALQRAACLTDFVPVSVISVYDTKVGNLCKYINPEAESNPLMVMSLLMRAAARLSDSLASSEEQLSLRRQRPYPPDIIQSSVIKLRSVPESILIEVIRIPCSLEKNVEPLTLNVSFNGYYLDVIAQELGVTNASKVLISRTIGKASSEMRVYYCIPKSYQLDPLFEQCAKEAGQYEGSLNARASYLSGQVIYGDAILASAGYKWKCTDFYHEDISLQTYHRIIINKIPSGIYKLSREAILAVNLPMAFTSRSNWRGSFPKEMLFTFCRQHQLSEPLFSVLSTPLKSSPDTPGSCKKLKAAESGMEESCGGDLSVEGGKTVVPPVNFKCEVKIFSKCQDLMIHCSPKESYKKQNDAMENAALKVLSWLNTYFNRLDMSLERLKSSANLLDIQFYPRVFFRDFVFCSSVHKSLQNICTQTGRLLNSNHSSQLDDRLENGVHVIIKGLESGSTPSSGSLVSVSYSISLVSEGEHMKELLESNEEFDFEMGTGAVLPQLETFVAQMSVGQSAWFSMELPPQELIFATVSDPARILSLLALRGCCLEYIMTLLRVTEPLEDRMEQALFSPSLSKQRVEFAVQYIKESCAISLVDFGCGSGSLLDSLLEYPTSLEKLAGVDISQKGLTRAAKMLHSKLSTNSEAGMTRSRIKSAVLYEGSITKFDSRLYGFDIGTCLEVVEHMEENEACLFGDVVLSSFCPRILIVSTPNYEYNVILQKSSLQSQEDDPDEKNQPQSCKFRNHDHKFEWTRQQFRHWASDLASRHNYMVEFSGVGGAADVEPGFASQIAIFRRGDNYIEKVESVPHYHVIWDWGDPNMSSSAR